LRCGRKGRDQVSTFDTKRGEKGTGYFYFERLKDCETGKGHRLGKKRKRDIIG
jgi:hypothetical protein